MSKIKILVASGIFILITAVKLIFPSLATDIKGVIIPVIDRHDDYRTAMAEVGELITGEKGVIAVLGRIYDKVIPASNMSSGYGIKEASSRTAGVKTDMQAKYSRFLPVDITHISQSPKPSETAVVTAAPAEPLEAGYPQTDITGEAGKAADTAEPADAAGAADAAAPAEPTEIAPSDITVLPVEASPVEYTEPVSAVVQGFADEQSGYTDEAIPANVLLDNPELPFDYCVPVAGYNSSGFGYRVHPIEEEVKFHFGTDFGAGSGTGIVSFAGGYVLIADEMESYGKYIIIDHGNDYRTLYAHCSELLVNSGDYVEMNQLIAEVGETGQATGPHLHFELLKSGCYLNPEFYF